jgi:SAM-dependent methyltransferase
LREVAVPDPARNSRRTADQLKAIYARRFHPDLEYRDAIWRILVREFFQQYVAPEYRVLDLGCGYGQFINNVQCSAKFGMDLNPLSASHLSPGVRFLLQDCCEPWALDSDSLDLVFTSNFFEHLPSKDALAATIQQVARCLRPAGRLIAVGPNIRYVGGAYWDFWDHHIPLTELSLCELLEVAGFSLERVESRFLPYAAVGQPKAPLFAISAYLRTPLAWKLFGQQFLIVAEKPASP